ncbi:hypothetical protein EJ08DRAFT_647106 [Tothia fuscella]|uniref:Uncharacterized protein n=1 Tax=Tothia fuscella TaxID=1048955 RepID=A0A9P4U0Q0_9PEZI|nr:hypothetical protein EJ08DRAFT_647106 [Tothia fuscella]
MRFDTENQFTPKITSADARKRMKLVVMARNFVYADKILDEHYGDAILHVMDEMVRIKTRPDLLFHYSYDLRSHLSRNTLLAKLTVAYILILYHHFGFLTIEHLTRRLKELRKVGDVRRIWLTEDVLVAYAGVGRHPADLAIATIRKDVEPKVYTSMKGALQALQDREQKDLASQALETSQIEAYSRKHPRSD